jgi:DtxR family Mn-dependent transcriptional regulator
MATERGCAQPDPVSIERSTGRYILAVHRLADGTDGRVTTGELREYLGVSAASVTEMVGKLDDRGLLDHEKYRGVDLTADGQQIATRLAWRHCVVTNFVESVLGTDLAETDLYEIGYALPAEGLVNLRELIDHPCLEQCPETHQEYDGCLA